jgi:hypothetical protein
MKTERLDANRLEKEMVLALKSSMIAKVAASQPLHLVDPGTRDGAGSNQKRI